MNSTNNSLFMRVLRGERTAELPIWLMRQAGRYLPEYRALRAQHKMLDLIRSAELAAEVTLQPMRRFKFDAAIIFADILNPLIGMGMQLDFVEGEGPKIFNPLKSFADIEALQVPAPAENVPYTLAAIKTVVNELGPTPLIGFSGAPFTLSTYMTESLRERDGAVNLMRSDPRAWNLLQEKLSTLVSDYLVAQVEAGASAVQLFDSWIGIVSPAEYQRCVYPWVKKIIAEVHSRTEAPCIYFGTGAAGLLPQFAATGAEGIGVDWRLSLPQARDLTGGKVVLQGNLDPTLLFSSWPVIETEVRRIAAEAAEIGPLIFNLGHGILPKTPLENVAQLVALVQSLKR